MDIMMTGGVLDFCLTEVTLWSWGGAEGAIVVLSLPRTPLLNSDASNVSIMDLVLGVIIDLITANRALIAVDRGLTALGGGLL